MRTLLLALPLALAACEGKPDGPSPPAMPASAVGGERVKDPVCGMWVAKDAPLTARHEGADYRFCAEDCLKKFQADPKRHATACACGKTSKPCPCGHCGAQGHACDCG